MIWGYHYFRKPPYWRHLLRRGKITWFCWEPYRVNSLGFCSWKLKRSTSSAFGSENMCSSRKHQKHWLKTIKNHLCLHSHSPKEVFLLENRFWGQPTAGVLCRHVNQKVPRIKLEAHCISTGETNKWNASLKNVPCKRMSFFWEVPVKRHYNCSTNEGHKKKQNLLCIFSLGTGGGRCSTTASWVC